MEDNTAITIIEPEPITPVRRSILTISDQQVQRIKLLAGMMAESALDYHKMNAGDIFIKMMKGLEIGLEPVASMDLIDVIQGKPTLKPQGMLALAWGSKLMESLSITDDGTTCTVKMQRVGSPVHIETFSAADANRMKTKEDGKMIPLSQKYNWRQMPAVMRKWRAVSAACRIVFPDIIQGMYIPEELSPDTIVDDSGEVVDAEYNDVEPTVEQQEAPKGKERFATKKEAPAGNQWNEDINQVTGFVKWCRESMVDYNQGDMLKALNDALDTPIGKFTSMKQYPGDKIHAMDAIMAFECGYDNTQIPHIIHRVFPSATEEQFNSHADSIELVNSRVVS